MAASKAQKKEKRSMAAIPMANVDICVAATRCFEGAEISSTREVCEHNELIHQPAAEQVC